MAARKITDSWTARATSAAALILMILLSGLAGAQTLSDAAVRKRSRAYLEAWTAPLGRPVEWREAESGDHGRITPLREHKNGDALCRDMEETLTVQGEARHGKATGCRDADWHWHIVASTPGDIAAGDTAPATVPADVQPYRPPADIAADPSQNGAAPEVTLRIRPSSGRSGAGPGVYVTVPPPTSD